MMYDGASRQTVQTLQTPVLPLIAQLSKKVQSHHMYLTQAGLNEANP